MTTFYFVDLHHGIRAEQNKRHAYVIGENGTYTDIREAKRHFNQIVTGELKRLQALRRKVSAARTREDLKAIHHG